MMRKLTLLFMAAILTLGMTMAMAQQTGGCVAVDTTGMTDADRAREGYHYDPATGDWYAADDNAARWDETKRRYADTSFPGWSYDPQTSRWYDDMRPGWSYDPLRDRWYSQDRPNMAYDMRTGRWYEDQMDRTSTRRDYVFDSETGRWYDYGDRYSRLDRMQASYYYDPEMGRWRNEPTDFRMRDERGVLSYMRETPRSMMTDDMTSRGEVKVRMAPASLRPGKDVYFSIRTDPSVSISDAANTTAYLTPADRDSNARYPMHLSHKGGNEFDARADITRPGEYWMVIRVAEPGQASTMFRYRVDIR